MVTSNKLPEKKFVKMTGQSSIAVVPQRTLLGEVNEHITCPLCRGYYIDATTIVECLHSFCRSCIIKHLQAKSYCPVCEMMINSAKPNIKLDKALQDIVYKLVPGLFQKEMERRQQFYASRPGPAASATPEQRGEDTERIIFSPEDVISFSLEYADITDSDSISSKSSDSNEPQPAGSRRYLQCPAVVNISHLKKFLSMKFDIDSTQFAIDVLYKRVPLPDYYTLMDIAYIYNWKRNEPMRFFYQIKDYIAIRNRFFDINRKGSDFRDRKPSPTSTEETNVGSPAPNLNDHVSEGSSGAESPMPEENPQKRSHDTTKASEKLAQNKESKMQANVINKSILKKNDEDVEKSQFLNSFELTAKSNNNVTVKCSLEKVNNINSDTPESVLTKSVHGTKVEDTLKRKHEPSISTLELKKVKIELEKAKIPNLSKYGSTSTSEISTQSNKISDLSTKVINSECSVSKSPSPVITGLPASPMSPKEMKLQPHFVTVQATPESPSGKRNLPGLQNNSLSPKRKTATETSNQPTQTTPKTVSPLKLQIPKLDSQSVHSKSSDVQKVPVKKIPDLKPSILSPQPLQNKAQPINKVRMDLLANNSDPIDRSKILSQVKTSLSAQNNGQSSGDPLKSIFDSCNINIPSSLSITLTDQKQDPRNTNETVSGEPKKGIVNKNLTNVNNNPSTHKVPSPPVHNYIEILKLPDTDSKTPNKTDSNSDIKPNVSNKSEGSPQSKNVNKSSESSAKGPIPNLKPISDTKLAKQSASGSFNAPITFQQTFEQQLQSLHTEKKSKLPKAKTQVPKLVPAPKVFNVNKSSTLSNKSNSGTSTSEAKSSSALDLSTPHNIQSQIGTQQTFDKALETMQSIANLAKKQSLPSKSVTNAMPLTQTNTFSGLSNRQTNPGVSPIRASSTTINQANKPNTHANTSRQDSNKIHSNKTSNLPGPNIPSQGYQMQPHNSPSPAQPSPRSQTRSPSSSPKLVIAEDKQTNVSIEHTIGQTNSIMNNQMPKLEPAKSLPGPSKSSLKPMKPLAPAIKVNSIRPPMTLSPSLNTTADYLNRPQLISTHHHLLRQMEVNAWLKVQRQFDLIKSMSNMAHQTQNDFNGKDKQ